jgi:putative ABC transport system permease protein
MTRLLFIKLLRDLQTTRWRIVMMIVAISLSMVAFSAMLYASSIVQSQESVGYASANPASARITLGSGIAVDEVEVTLGLARAERGVIDATMRSVFASQMQEEGGELSTTQLQLFAAAPDDPMRIATFKVEQGTWPPPPDGILMERSALKSLNLKVGDSVLIADADDKPVSFTITGAVHDPSLAPGRYGFISTDSLPLLGRPAALDQLAITVADQAGLTEPSRDRDGIVRTALSLADRLKATRGMEIEQVAVPPPYEHPHHGVSNSLLTALLAFGALSLLLSAILIATMFNGLLTQQIPQIGILKAIGARSNRILQLYLIMILLVSAAATAIAFVPGIMLGQALAQNILTGALNMDVTSLSIPWWNYGAVIVLGGILPLLMALLPLIQASRRTVREALDDRGVDRLGVRATSFYAWLGRLRGVDRTLLMSFRNLFRRRGRLLLSVGLLATAGAIFVAGLNTMAGFQALPQILADTHSWDVEVRLEGPASVADVTNRLARIPSVTRVEAWNTVSTGVQYPGELNVTSTYPDQGHGSSRLTALPVDSALFNPPPVLEGRWLRADDTDAIVLPQTMRKALAEVGVGDSVQLAIDDRLTDWRVVGIVKELGGATCPCVSSAGFEQATGRVDQANVFRIAAARQDPDTSIAIGQGATEALAAAAIKGQYRTLDSLISASTEGHSGLLVALLLLIASVIGAVGLIGLGSMMSTNVIERTREFGVMSAIGAPASTVRNLVVFEGIFIAVISCMVAAVPALILTALMGVGLGNLFMGAPVPFRVSGSAITIWIVIVVLGAVLATLAPASRASRLTVREALAYL